MSGAVGYQYLIETLKLECRELPVRTVISPAVNMVLITDGVRRLPPSYEVLPNLIDNLIFAVKHEGLNLEVLAAAFDKLPAAEMATALTGGRAGKYESMGKYERILWFAYEGLTGARLPIADLPSGIKYADVLNERDYFTAEPDKLSRYKLNNNLLGDFSFCPMVRRTPALERMVAIQLDVRLTEAISDCDAKRLNRAISFLYSKETRCSFGIERETPSPSREQRFLAALHRCGNEPVSFDSLLDVQQAILDTRHINIGYRQTQNWIGASIGEYRHHVEYIPPKPQDVTSIMAGILTMLNGKRGIHPVLKAACASFGFVYVHPFEDGNGRTHRYLIHQALAYDGFLRDGMILPVSAAMLRNLDEYTAVLDKFDAGVMPRLDYTIVGDGLACQNNHARYYRYFDATAECEYLFEVIRHTIEMDVKSELVFLDNFDRFAASVKNEIDLPDKQIGLLVSLLGQNDGKLSTRKRSQFPQLTDDEVATIERIYAAEFAAPKSTEADRPSAAKLSD